LLTKVDKLQEQFHTTQTTVPTSQSSNVCDASSAAIKAIEEIADRECRKNNIIVYNLLEGENKEASALVLLNYILEQQVNITKVFHLGRKMGKNRSLLIGEETKLQTLAAAPCLRSSTQFPNVYVLPDCTRAEQQQHK